MDNCNRTIQPWTEGSLTPEFRPTPTNCLCGLWLTLHKLCLYQLAMHIGDIIREDILLGEHGLTITYASFFLGPDALPFALPNWTQAYSFDYVHQPMSFPGYTGGGPTAYQSFSSSNWIRFKARHLRPDVLFIWFPSDQQVTDEWFLHFVELTPTYARLIIVLERGPDILGGKGQWYKGMQKKFKRCGYTGYLKFLSCAAAGSALWGGHFWTVYTLRPIPDRPDPIELERVPAGPWTEVPLPTRTATRSPHRHRREP